MKKHLILGSVALIAMNLTACGADDSVAAAQAQAEPTAIAEFTAETVSVYEEEPEVITETTVAETTSEITESETCYAADCCPADNSAVYYGAYEAAPGGCCW